MTVGNDTWVFGFNRTNKTSINTDINSFWAVSNSLNCALTFVPLTRHHTTILFLFLSPLGGVWVFTPVQLHLLYCMIFQKMCSSNSIYLQVCTFMQLGFSMKLAHLSPVHYWFIHNQWQAYMHDEVGRMPPKLKQ